ncbi:23S rRNA pseudouridine955/2504/2580 synthase [Mycoplasma testudineum]|uniref:RNA pseudouridylate synthase n=1 Tax=Mycoplasma testudineum TaxID=244584 RepID=A0A4R6IE73_9MOLU|nr:RluA family pseudouridine synthase [Mycoplasma testudineum]OYD26797.1 RNA pseudouridine synthase [Mycoplasma testudineum]TDO20332.1 23S rRNA pseudouridine955/2504/2580 synthase [Mycoplasma testudineum]
MFTIDATENDQGKILFKVVRSYLNNVPNSRVEKIFRLKDIKVNGKRNVDKDTPVMAGDQIIIYGIENPKVRNAYQPVEIKFNVIYEDDNILIIDKPTGIVMHGEPNSLDNQVLRYLKFVQKDSFIPSSIGRIDKFVSGLVCYAKNYKTLRELKTEKNIEKIYTYKADILVPEKHTVNFYHEYNPIKQRAILYKEKKPDTKVASTILWDEGNYHYAQLLTGRKHQIRVTLSKLGFPIYGDKYYGGKNAKQIYLHSYMLKFKGLNQDLEYLNKQVFISKPKW